MATYSGREEIGKHHHSAMICVTDRVTREERDGDSKTRQVQSNAKTIPFSHLSFPMLDQIAYWTLLDQSKCQLDKNSHPAKIQSD
jgi:hypothetical protein